MIKVKNMEKAWGLAHLMLDGIGELKYNKTAGYKMAGAENGWVSDLGDRLEVNFDDGDSWNIWIDDEEPKITLDEGKAMKFARILAGDDEADISICKDRIIVDFPYAEVTIWLEGVEDTPEPFDDDDDEVEGIPKITEYRTWNSSAVVEYCKSRNLYTCGSDDEYFRMLRYVSEHAEEPGKVELFCVAEDILKHSETELSIGSIMTGLFQETVIVEFDVED